MALDADEHEAAVREEYRSRLPDPVLGKHVLILGHPSSGKTSTIKRLVADNPQLSYVYDNALLGSGRFLNYTTELFERRNPRVYFPYEMEALLVRFLQNRPSGSSSICDQGIESIWAYARTVYEWGGVDRDHYQTFFAHYLAFRSLGSLPRLVVRFRCDSGVARERVIARGRAHELVALPANFIANLDQNYETAVRSFPNDVTHALLDTTVLNEEQAVSQLKKILDEGQP